MSPQRLNSGAKIALAAGCILCFLAVALGAFGAHALESVLIANERLDVYETANRYHFYHAIALLVVGALNGTQQIQTSIRSVAYLLILGTTIFSGSLYLLAVTNIAWLGAVTPVGGLLLLLAWLLLAKDVLLTHR